MTNKLPTQLVGQWQLKTGHRLYPEASRIENDRKAAKLTLLWGDRRESFGSRSFYLRLGPTIKRSPVVFASFGQPKQVERVSI